MAPGLHPSSRKMPSVATKYFGTLSYADESVYDFPQGLPAFEREKAFVLVQLPERAPLVFLQSLASPALCFLAFPILVVDPDYQLAIAPEELEALGLDAQRQPELGPEVLALALVSLHADFSATANLMAPIVLNLKSRRGLQSIRRDARYSHQQPVGAAAGQTAPAAGEGISESAC